MKREEATKRLIQLYKSMALLSVSRNLLNDNQPILLALFDEGQEEMKAQELKAAQKKFNRANLKKFKASIEKRDTTAKKNFVRNYEVLIEKMDKLIESVANGAGEEFGKLKERIQMLIDEISIDLVE